MPHRDDKALVLDNHISAISAFTRARQMLPGSTIDEGGTWNEEGDGGKKEGSEARR
jgi:hypothetical protein